MAPACVDPSFRGYIFCETTGLWKCAPKQRGGRRSFCRVPRTGRRPARQALRTCTDDHATRVFIPDPGSWEGELTPCARIGIQPLANQCHDKGGPSERHCLPGCGVWHKSVDIWRRQGVGEREGNIQKTITTRHPPALIIPVLRPTQYHHDRHNVTEQ